jgi:hypothetical protein
MNAMDIDEEKRKKKIKIFGSALGFLPLAAVGRLPHFGSLAAVARAPLGSGWAWLLWASQPSGRVDWLPAADSSPSIARPIF